MQWFHHFFLTWMQFILDWGYLGIFIMMAFESTALPIPAEVVMPPAAYWAAQGHFNFTLVILAATAGSWAGSAVSYWLANNRPNLSSAEGYIPETVWNESCDPTIDPNRCFGTGVWFLVAGSGGYRVGVFCQRAVAVSTVARRPGW